MPSEPVRSSLVALKRTIMARVLQRKGIPVPRERLEEFGLETPFDDFYKELVRENAAREAAEAKEESLAKPGVEERKPPAKTGRGDGESVAPDDQPEEKPATKPWPSPDIDPALTPAISRPPATDEVVSGDRTAWHRTPGSIAAFFLWAVLFHSPVLLLSADYSVAVTLAGSAFAWGLVGMAQAAAFKQPKTPLFSPIAIWLIVAWVASSFGFHLLHLTLGSLHLVPASLHQALGSLDEALRSAAPVGAVAQNPVRVIVASLLPGFFLGFISASLYGRSMRESTNRGRSLIRNILLGAIWAAIFFASAYGALLSLYLANHIAWINQNPPAAWIAAALLAGLFAAALCLGTLRGFGGQDSL